MGINENLERELDKQFPKEDKARGRALVLFAIAQLEIDKWEKKYNEVRDILEDESEEKKMNEFGEIKAICKEHLDALGINSFTIIFARRIKESWKVTVRYSKPDNPEILSSFIINWKTKKVDKFMEDIPTF